MTRIAIVGSGIAALGAAHKLHPQAEITVFESESWVGGHSHTVDVTIDGTTIPVDTGFIVYNEITYPHLTALFAELNVATEPSDMSFAIGGGLIEYEGSGRGMFAQPSAALDPQHWRMIADILAFNRASVSDVNQGVTIGELTAGYSDAFKTRYLRPMIAAIWSTPEADAMSYPAATLLRFFSNHGLMQVRDRPQWRTVTGGARSYVAKLTEPFAERIRTDTPVHAVRRDGSDVIVDTTAGSESFDHVVFGTHADTTLAILGADVTPNEQRLLSAFRYSRNRAVLHSDPRLMPRSRKAWASWNVLEGQISDVPAVTYWMNRLQNIGGTQQLFLTLNPTVEPRDIHGEWEYDHPMFDQQAIDAQGSLHELQGVSNAWFAGAYFRYGFHEDGLASGFGAAADLLKGVRV